MSPHTDAGALLKLAERVNLAYLITLNADGVTEGHLTADELGQIVASLRQAASQGNAGGERSEVQSREAIAFELWQRFAPVHHIGWADETHKADYYAAADGVLGILPAAQAPIGCGDVVGWQARDKVRGGVWLHVPAPRYNPDFEYRPLYASPPAQGAWKCQANPRAVVPEDCDWPNCGCDPHAQRVMQGLIECGWEPPTSSVPSAQEKSPAKQQGNWARVTEPCRHQNCEFPACDCEWDPIPSAPSAEGK